MPDDVVSVFDFDERGRTTLYALTVESEGASLMFEGVDS